MSNASAAALVPVDRGEVSFDQTTLDQIRSIRLSLNDFTAEQAQGAAIWAAAVAAAANAKRAWDVAQEAFELQIRAERKLGILWIAAHQQMPANAVEGRLLRGEKPKWTVSIEARKQGAIHKLGEMPADVFEETIQHLIESEKSVDIYTVLRISHLRSLQFVEEGITQAWDGSYFISTGSGRPRRAKSTRLDRVRADYHEMLRLQKRPARDPVARRLDDAFAEARKDAQALSKLRDSIHGEAGRLCGEAELLQAQVAELLFRAYKCVEVAKPKGQR